MSFRFNQCELTNCGVLGPQRAFEWGPGLNLVIGDAQSGKTTLVRALVAAFRGLPPGDLYMLATTGSTERVGVDLKFDTRHDTLALTCDFRVPSVELLAKGSRLFNGPNHAALLATLEKHTRQVGLARTWALTIDPMSFTLPPAIQEIFDVLHGTETRTSGELARERTRVQHQQADLVRARAAVLKRQEKLFTLRQRIAEQYARFVPMDEEFPIQLLCLSLARSDLRRFKEEDQAQKAGLQRRREELDLARAELAEKYPGYVELPSDFPQLLAEYRALEARLAERQGQVTAREQRVAELEEQLKGYRPRFESRPADLQMRLTAIVAMEGTASEQRARRESEARAIEEVNQSLKMTVDAMARLKRYETVSDEFPQQIAELGRVRRELAEQRERVEALDERLQAAEHGGAAHKRALSWPDDFPDRLQRLRADQKSCEARAQELNDKSESVQNLRQERTELQKRLEGFGGLERTADDFPERVAELVATRQQLHDQRSALRLVQQRIAGIDETLDSRFPQRTRYGDDFLEQLEQLRRRQGHLDDQKRDTMASLSQRQELENEAKSIHARSHDDFTDFKGTPDDLPAKLRAYFRLSGVRRDLEAQKAEIATQMAHLQDRLAAEFASFTSAEAPLQGRFEQLRGWDTFRRQQLLRLDWELTERHQVEVQSRSLDAEAATLSAWADLPDGFPALLALRDDLERVCEDAADEPGDIPDLTERSTRLHALHIRHLQQKARNTAAAELKAAQGSVASLAKDLTAMSPKGVNLTAYRSKEQDVLTARDAVRSKHRGRRTTTKLKLFGGSETASDPLLKKLAEAEESLNALLESWPAEVDVAALLDNDRQWREKLAAAQGRVAACEGLLAEYPEDKSLAEDGKALGVATSEEAETAWQSTQEQLLRSARSAQRARIKAVLPALAFSGTREAALEAYHRLRTIAQQRAGLRERLGLLRSSEELHAQRQDLLALVAQGLKDLEKSEGHEAEQHIRQYLDYQYVQTELARLTTALAQVGRRSGGRNDLEQVTQQLAHLATLLGPLVDKTAEDTLARWDTYRGLQRRSSEIVALLAEIPTEAVLREGLDTLEAEVRQDMERLHVSAEQGVSAAVEAYHEYRTLLAERDGLDGVLRTRWHLTPGEDGRPESDVDRLEAKVAGLAATLEPWASRMKSTADADALVERWRQARATSGSLQWVEAEGAALAVLEENLRRVEEETRTACTTMGVPETEEEDAELLRQWHEASAWREQSKGVREERDRFLDPQTRADGRVETVVDRLQDRADQLEQALQILPTEDPDLVLRAFRRFQTLRARHDELSTRLKELGSPPDVQAEQQKLRDKIQAALRDLGLPTDVPAAATFKEYQEYRRFLKELKAAQSELGATLKGEETLEKLQQALDALRPRLGGRHDHQDVEAEATAFAEFQQAQSRCQAMAADVEGGPDETSVATSIRETEELIAEKETQVGEWIKTTDPDEVLAEYQEYLKLKAQMDEQAEALKELPSTAELMLRLEAAARLLTELDAHADGDPQGGTRLVRQRATLAKLANRVEAHQASDHRTSRERCFERASGLLEKVSGGRYRKLTIEDGNAFLSLEDKHVPVPERGQVRHQIDLCWKLAVCLELGNCSPWPLILDEPFLGTEAPGRASLVTLLTELADKHQIIVLTRERSLELPVTQDLNAAPAAAQAVAT